MDIITKAVNATIEDTSANADEFPGTFMVELSNESIDRDGDELKADEWETPLPQQITFVNDHTHKMASVVGSATPELVNGKILCKGEWAATDAAQDTRKVIKHVPYVSVAYREKRNQKAGTVSRELVNGSFVVVPSNTKARVLASKAFGDEGEEVAREFAEMIAKQLGTLGFKALPDVHGTAGGSALPAGFTAETELDTEKSYSTLTVKDAVGNVLLTHKFSQAPESGAPQGPTIDSADTAKEKADALDQLKATAGGIITNATQFA